MIKISNILVPPQNTEDIKAILSSTLKIPPKEIKSYKLFKRSVDARKKPDVKFCDTYLVEVESKATENRIIKKNSGAALYAEKKYEYKKALNPPKNPVLVVGSGPAGLFSALTLIEAGIPILIVEKGKPILERIKDVESFWQTGILNESSNVQFGEGGAGTFSDGKLNTGIKDPRCLEVLKTFNRFGADKDILINAKPHIGTDVLRDVVVNIRKYIEEKGGKYLFSTEFIKPVIKDGKVSGALLKSDDKKYTVTTENIVLAIGNSARKTAKALYNEGVNIIPKPFAIGVRIEHSQQSINASQYGKGHNEGLPPAEYKLATHLESGRGVYTFCMCPGGLVVNSASEENTYVTNGMSYKARDKENANSALLVGVDEKDFCDLAPGTPFGGIVLQEQIEKAAFNLTKGKGLPAQRVGDFLKISSKSNTDIKPTAKPKVVFTDITEIFPSYISDSLKEALPLLDKKIKGFADSSAVLTAPETRSSSPIRIVRDENHCSNILGLYPAGEGAGYAGGITSSAVDGMRTAEKIIEKY